MISIRSVLAGTASAACFAAAIAAVPAAAQQVPITNGYLDGKWKDNILCLGKPQFEFDNMGNVVLQRTASAKYAVTGPSQITVGTANGQISFTVRYIDADTMWMSDNQGNAGEAHRCSPTPQAAYNMQQVPAPYAPPAPPMQQYGNAPTPAYLIGRWTDTNNCSVTNTFYPNGTLVSGTGASTNWTIQGNLLSVTAPGGSALLNLYVMDQNTMQTVDPNGVQGISRRCP